MWQIIFKTIIFKLNMIIQPIVILIKIILLVHRIFFISFGYYIQF